MVLIGCQSDLRIPNDSTQISPEAGQLAKGQIGAVDWMECTFKEKDSVNNVSQSLAYHGYHYRFSTRGNEDGQCVVL